MPDAIYVNMPLTKEDFVFVRGSLSSTRAKLFDKAQTLPNGPEKLFYLDCTERTDAILEKFNCVPGADTSQDEEPDVDDEPDED